MRAYPLNLYGWCVALAMAMCAGQVMFKMASATLEPGTLSLQRLIASPWFLGALVLYGGTTFLWVYILSRMPLSIAYPFTLLGAAMVPFAAHFMFGEVITTRMWIGVAFVLGGLWIMNFK